MALTMTPNTNMENTSNPNIDDTPSCYTRDRRWYHY